MGKETKEERLRAARAMFPDLVIRPDRRRRRVVPEHGPELDRIRREVAAEVMDELLQRWMRR